MNRKQLFEIHDYDWFPKIWRDMITNILSNFELDNAMYAPVARLLAPLIKRNERFEIVDLCSGAGHPIVTVLDSMEDDVSGRVSVTLTDLFPNVDAFEEIAQASPDNVAYVAEPVDATAVPEKLSGFRTCFTAFHHFDHDTALAMLSDTVAKRQGIGIFEYTERRLLRYVGLGVAFQLWLLWRTLTTVPRDRKVILWTCIVPIVPLVFMWDAFASIMRTYSVAELEGLVAEVGDCGYVWEAGTAKTRWQFRVTYLIGYPA